MEKPCTCGDTTIEYHPDENQHEPACWECYDRARNEICSVYVIDEDELPF
jgi:hypothetical protein